MSASELPSCVSPLRLGLFSSRLPSQHLTRNFLWELAAILPVEVNSSPQKTAQPSEQNEAWNGIPEQDAFLPMPRSGDVDLCHSRFQNQFLAELRHRARSVICSVSFSYCHGPARSLFSLCSGVDWPGVSQPANTELWTCSLVPYFPLPVAATKHFDKSPR